MKTVIKRVPGYVVAFLLGSLMSGGVALAATTYVQAQKGTSAIELNGKTISKPPKLIYGGTTYVQLYSIQQGLAQVFGQKPTWDGTNFNILTSNTGGGSGTPSQPTNSDQGIVFSNITVKSDGVGDTIVDGIAKNTTSSAHTFFITVTFYDANGKILGTASGAVDNLASGDSKTFEAIASSDYTKAAKYTVQVDAMS